ncbi:MAG: hypothetical protein FD155_2865 [Bacteroidetes bacterium]|nr:MAG: hypothetical protein FD155_2865 [Bacteroidota bacterium]
MQVAGVVLVFNIESLKGKNVLSINQIHQTFYFSKYLIPQTSRNCSAKPNQRKQVMHCALQDFA